MQKHCQTLLLILIFSSAAMAQFIPDNYYTTTPAEAPKPVTAEAAVVSAEAVKPVSAEAVAVSAEAVKPVSVEALAVPSGEAAPQSSPEASSLASKESLSTPPPGIVPTAESPIIEIKPLEEGASYKGVPWGADFSQFKQIKGFSGSLGSPSAAFVNSSCDNDIALLLDVPLSGKGKKGEQRVMFEYVPQKFSSVYIEPDDINYIFYDAKFCMAFSKLMESNFDLYRDNFYKKYQKTGSITRVYNPSATKKYRVDAIAFEKGKTRAFLIKSQTTEGKKTTASARMLLVSKDLFDNIQKEIEDKAAGEKQSKGIDLEKDLNKIE